MLWPILNNSRRQYPTRHQLYGHLPPITKTIQVRRTRHAGHCWRSRDELISDVLLWTPTYGQAKAGRPARKYIQQLCEDMGCSPEHLPEAMNDREKWRERARDIRASGTTWWWWWVSFGFIAYQPFIYKLLNVKTVLFLIIQFSALFSSIWPIDRTLSGATTLGSDGNKGVFRILPNSSTAGPSPSDSFVCYSGRSLGESHPSTERQSVYSIVLADWARITLTRN